MIRAFPLGPVVSVYYDRMLCTFTEYRAFLDYMTNAEVGLLDIPSARRMVALAVARQLPELAKATGPPEKTDSGNATRYVRRVAKEVGYDEVELTPLRKGRFQPRMPSVALYQLTDDLAST